MRSSIAVDRGLTVRVTSSSEFISVEGVRVLWRVLPVALVTLLPSLAWGGLVAWSRLIFALLALRLFLDPLWVSLLWISLISLIILHIRSFVPSKVWHQ